MAIFGKSGLSAAAMYAVLLYALYGTKNAGFRNLHDWQNAVLNSYAASAAMIRARSSSCAKAAQVRDDGPG